jgi:hypothetical protein
MLVGFSRKVPIVHPSLKALRSLKKAVKTGSMESSRLFHDFFISQFL